MSILDYWQTLPRHRWQDDAICAGYQWDYWFDGDESMGKLICSHCPVSDDCLAFALEKEPNDLKHRWGVFGGMNPDERHAFAALLLKEAEEGVAA